MEKVMRNKFAITVFLIPAVLLFVVIIVLPIFMSGFFSLMNWDGIRPMEFIGFGNYLELFNSSDFLRALLNVAIIAAASLVIQLPLSLLLALTLSNRVKGARFFVTVFFIPVVLSSVVIGQLWMRIYNLDSGLLNLFLRAIGATEAGSHVWLGEPKTAFIAVLVPILWQFVGYHMLLFYSGIRSISPDIFEAAKIDGAGFWRTAFSISIPMLKPIFQVSVIFAVTGSMKVFDLVKVLTDGGPTNTTHVVTTLLVKNMFYPGNRYGYGSSMAIVLILECFLLYIFINRLFRNREGYIPKRRRIVIDEK